AMADPINTWFNGLASRAGLASPLAIVTLFFFIALVLFPAIASGAVVLLRRLGGDLAISVRELLCSFSLALVPLGAAMWAAHFLFHLLSGYAAAWPVLQQTASDWGFTFLGPPNWALSSLRFSPDAVVVLQTLLLDAGLLLTLYLCWR